MNISRKYPYKNGSAFIEFNSYNTAKNFIREFNNSIINGHLIILDWAKPNIINIINNEKEKESVNKNSLYTVSYIKN